MIRESGTNQVRDRTTIATSWSLRRALLFIVDFFKCVQVTPTPA